MGKIKRFFNLIIAALMILICIVVILEQRLGILFVALFFAFYMIIKGARLLQYYLTMARHMVGGHGIIYKAIIYLDLGLFMLTVADTPEIYVILYIVIYMMIGACLDIVSALEAKKQGGSWKLKLGFGICLAGIAAVSGLMINVVGVGVFVVCIYYGVSAVSRIVATFKKTAIVYIQ